MNSRVFIQFFIFISFIALLGACNNRERNSQLLDNAARLIETDLEQAIKVLRDVKIDRLNEEEYAWFTLLQVRVWNLEDMNISASETAVLNAKDYFIKRNNTEKSAYACFIYAHIYYAEGGNTSKAVYYFLQAEEWAAKVAYTIPNLTYSLIPYNIALIYNEDKKYEEALLYLNKAMGFISTEKGKYERELHALELKGIIFDALNQTDSALFAFEKAWSIAEAHNDTESKTRTLHNQSRLYTKIEDYTLGEEKCKQSLTLANPHDSLTLSYVYMTLANIYNKANLLDSAIVNIYKSKKYLSTILVYDKYFFYKFYRLLFQLEQKRGDIKKAEEYKTQYEHHKGIVIGKKEDPKESQLQKKIMKANAKHIGALIRQRDQSREEIRASNNTAMYTLVPLISTLLLTFIYSFLKAKTIKKRINAIINETDEKWTKIIAGNEQEHKQEVLELQQIFKTELEDIEAKAKEFESKAVNQAFRKVLKEHGNAIKAWEIKYKECEKERCKHLNQLNIWDKERKQMLKMHLQEVGINIQRIKKLAEAEKLLLSENVYASKRQITEIRETINWSSIKSLLTPAYHDMFDKLKEEFEALNDEEYMFCCLYVTGVFSAIEIMSILGANDEQYKTIKDNTIKKLNAFDKNLAYLRRYSKTIDAWKKESAKKSAYNRLRA